MKRIATIFSLVLFLLLPGLSGHTSFHPVAAGWLGQGYAEDLDAARKGNGVNSRAVMTDDSMSSMMATTCAIVPIWNTCTKDKLVYQDLMKQSALFNVGQGLAFMYTNPPADTGAWIADAGRSLGFLPQQVQAQGIGFNGLAPLLPIWKAFRNIAYLLLALAMIFIGFMVMFRKKIDPKTVVTVQNSLPKIVITMLLITFSYAIVGLMVDVMYLSISFINLIVRTGFEGGADLTSNFTGGGIWALLGGVFGPVIRYNPLTRIAPDVTAGIQNSESILTIGVGVIQNVIASVAFGASTVGLGFVFQFILALAFIFAFIRLFFMLLSSYIQVLLSVITAPIQILMGVFPGINGFGMWMVNLVSNLIAFPITIFLLMVANVLPQNFNEGTLWVPPLLPQPLGSTESLGLVGTGAELARGTGTSGSTQIGGIGGLAVMLISLGFVMTIPNIVDSIRKALKAQAAVPGGVGAVAGPLGAGIGQLMQFGYQASFITSAFRKHDTTDTQTAIKGMKGGALGSVVGDGGHGGG